jgi:16S rRNA (uracil1498-N3)-methyltransferase
MPAARRFYINIQGLSQDLVLSGSEHNHLANVLRLRIGDEVIIVCGDEVDYYYKISEIKKSQTKLTFIGKQQNTHNPKTKLTVYMGVIKHDNLALATEKLNEIGVTEVVLFKSANSQNIPVKLEKLQAVAQQSCKQCGRSIPVKVGGVLTFEEVLKEIPENVIFADPTTSAARTPIPAKGIIIGPEGGFTDSEREKLRQKAMHVSLGPRILRAETAAIVGAALILWTSSHNDGEI